MVGTGAGVALSRNRGTSSRRLIQMGRWSEMDYQMEALLIPASVTIAAVWVVRM